MIYILRRGVPVAVPFAYEADPVHMSLVSRLDRAESYTIAVTLLEAHGTEGYLAADVLAGVNWARRFLTTTARLSAGPPTQRRLAARGWRALMHVLNGMRPRVGRHRESISIATLDKAATVLTRWREVVDALWGGDRTTVAAALLAEASGRFAVSRAHQRATRALLRRPGLRKRDVVLTFTSWETGVPLRRLRRAVVAADFVYA